jgi:DNA-binding NarL/FixJ family response regulator
VAGQVSRIAAAPQIPGEAFAKLYGLTGGELRVVLALVPGFGAKEAAEVIGLSETTVRTHLQSVFEKTGTTRQTELIKLLMASAPPIRPPM